MDRKQKCEKCEMHRWRWGRLLVLLLCSGKIAVKECLSLPRSLYPPPLYSFQPSLISRVVLLVRIGFVRLVFLNECHKNQQREEKHVLLYVAFTNVTDRIAIYIGIVESEICVVFFLLSLLLMTNWVAWYKSNVINKFKKKNRNEWNGERIIIRKWHV